MIHVTVNYSGHVQGVGFRYTVLRLAQRCEVAGYVKNRGDGQVELVVEGDTEQVERLLEAVRDRMADYIEDERIERGQATGAFGRPTAGGIRIEY